MSVRELVVLGTSSQVPTRFRNHNGYLLRWDEEGILFDPGEGTQRQMILADVSASSINRICVTHFHGDHCLGLPGVIQRLSLDRVRHEVSIYYPASGQSYFERLRRASIFHDVSHVSPVPVSEEGLIGSARRFDLKAMRLNHGVDTWGYRLEEHDDRTMLPDKLTERGVFGPDIGKLKREGRLQVNEEWVELEEVSVAKPGQVVAFVMDTRLCDTAFELAQDADLLVCESTYLSTETREARNNGHLTASQAARIARDAGARKLVLTHFSQRYPNNTAFVDEAREIFENTVAARDLARIPVPRRKT